MRVGGRGALLPRVTCVLVAAKFDENIPSRSMRDLSLPPFTQSTTIKTASSFQIVLRKRQRLLPQQTRLREFSEMGERAGGQTVGLS